MPVDSARLPGEFMDFVDYIVKTYGRALKIVEVGVGRFCEVAVEIKRRLPHVEVVVTDVNVETVREVRQMYPMLKVAQDNVTNPNISSYTNANLVYSIRAPPELWLELMDLAQRVHADLIIRPLPTETPVTLLNFKLVNFGKARFYIWHPSKR